MIGKSRKKKFFLPRRSRRVAVFHRFVETYRKFSQTIRFLFGLMILLDRCLRTVSDFLEKLYRILHVIHGWICLIRSICSALHLIASRLMILSWTFYRLFYLLTRLFEPVSNRSLEKAARTFSRCFFDYYSSDGGCYTLKDRTHHLVRRVRERWRKSPTDDEIYYDALSMISEDE